MDIRFSKHFVKQYTKLTPTAQRQFDERLALWKLQPAHPTLHHHKLRGSMSRFYSINVNGDLRALYEIIDDQVYMYAMIGTHANCTANSQ